MKNNFILSILILGFFVSCEMYPQDDYEEQYVVESYLVANRQLPFVRLSTTLPAGDFYDFENAAVNDAEVQIRLLEGDAGSDIVSTYRYTRTEPGIYLPDFENDVLPNRTYELYVTFPGSEEFIRAHAIVPDTFQIVQGVRDSIIYQSSEQLEITLSESSYPGRQNIYVFNAIGQDPRPQNLTPLYFDFYQRSDVPEEDLNDFANNSSGIINQANFELNADGSTTVSYPWIGIAFYGENLIVANTMDDNIYDFLRSQEVQLGGSTISPGEIQNVIYNIEGGIGVFGALASDTVTTYVKRNPNLAGK